MIKYINESGRKCYKNVKLKTPFNPQVFHKVQMLDDDFQMVLHTNLGSFTVLDRMTGFGYRDVETGYRSPDKKFWLASGDYDVRNQDNINTFEQAIDWIKKHANSCTGE